MRLLLLLIMISSTCLGEVKFLTKGSVSPYDGYIFSTDAELKLRQDLADLEALKLSQDSYKRVIELLKQENTITQAQVGLWHEESTSLAKENASLRSDSFWGKAALFALGVAATVAITYSVNQK